MGWLDSLKDIKKSLQDQEGLDKPFKTEYLDEQINPELEPEKGVISNYGLSSEEASQVLEYIKIYKKESLEKHWEVNEYITSNSLWGRFSEIRSLNDHGDSKRIPGILPKFYAIVCKILEITSSNGAPLDKSEKY